MNKSYSYNDIYLTPKYSIIRSRSEADISVEFLGRKFKAPWIPANMESVIDEKAAKWLSENDYFYIYHRFGDTKAFIEKATKENWKTVSISIGVKKEDRQLIEWVVGRAYNLHYICIDVAHGHHILVEETIGYIKEFYSNAGMNRVRPKIIAGNVATPEAVKDLADWGADAVKVGIAGGAACSTKHQTGFHIPMFSCVKESYERGGGHPYAIKSSIPIVADGGIRENGDIPKALVAGATMVMAGSLFAACIDAPGENVHKEDINFVAGNFGNAPSKPYYGTNGPITHKRYHGSASAKQKGEHKHVEGLEMEIPCNGMTYEQKYQELSESLKSAVSYAGGNSLSSFETVGHVIAQ